jgi:hypothetical protein
VKLPSDYSSWYSRHKTNIYLIFIVVIASALMFGIRASLDPPIPTESIILFLIGFSLAGAVYFYPYVKELIDRNTASDP